MRTRRWVLAMAAVAGWMAGPAQADVTVRADLGGFGYRLIDLDPQDGITPALRLENLHYSVGGSIREGPATQDWNRTVSAGAGTSGAWQDGATVFRQAGGPNSEVAERLSGSVAAHSFSAMLRGQARNSRADKTFVSLFSVLGQPALSVYMTLTPATEVVWTGELALQAGQTLGRRLGRVEEGGVEVGLSLAGVDPGAPADRLYRSLALEPGLVIAKSERLDVQLSFSNLSSSAATALLETRMTLEGRSFMPVPEAGTPVLMLSGLGLLAAVCRTRRRGGR